MPNTKENKMQIRILKKFLGKLTPPAIGIVYVLAALELGAQFANPLHSIAVVGLMVIVPMVAYILYETWQMAKREVEDENRELMRSIEDA
jgi:hypothetical protein